MTARSYILPPTWYPWDEEQSVITLGTVYSDHLMSRDASRWKGKGNLKTLIFNEEGPGEVRIHKEAHWEMATWLKFLDFLNIGVGGGKAEDIAVKFKWQKLERTEVHPDLQFPAYCKSLVSQDRRQTNGETMATFMNLGRMRHHRPLWIVSGIQITTGLEIWIERHKTSHSQAAASASDPNSGVGGGFSASQGSGVESFMQRKVDGKVIFACQIHKIDQPKFSNESKVKVVLETTGTVLSDEPETEMELEGDEVEVTRVDLGTDPRLFHMHQ